MWHFSYELLQQASTDNLRIISASHSCKLLDSKYLHHHEINIDLFMQDRYRELMRVARMWRHLKAYKWHGFAHRSDSPKAGDLALFCPACPQPGINISSELFDR